MLKYKVALVTLLVIFFAAPSQVLSLPLQTLQSPAIAGTFGECTFSNVGSDIDVLVNVQIFSFNGGVLQDDTFNVAPGATGQRDDGGAIQARRCTIRWVGHRGDFIGSFCARFESTDPTHGMGCISLK